MNLEVAQPKESGIPVLALSGEVDIAVVGQVEQALASVEAQQPPILLLDLRDLSFLDSSGLRVVLEADLRARRQGRRLVVVRGPDPVHRVFTVATLDKRLEFVEDPRAVQSVRP